ncbi:hypothetical protein ACGFJT_17755 [Actinomadura geliboluensis]|uniref:hypothetical protein n=1 Tax=Actinomadura geliboluensis TaxID=882440 RepID=UPI0037181F88
MTSANEDKSFEIELEIEIEEELTLVESSRPEEAAVAPVGEWLFDPADAERDEVGLRNLLGAVEKLEGDS